MKKGLIFGIGILGVIFISIFLINNQNEKTSAGQKQTSVNQESKANTTQTKQIEKAATSTFQTGTAKGKTTGKTTENTATKENKDKQLEKYRMDFEQINNTADKRVDSLIEQAKTEYKAKKERKEDLTQFKPKYEAILENYEQKTKSQFDFYYKSLEKDTANKDAGQEFTADYQAKKMERYKKLKTELAKLS
ncbi:hypothetical protein PH210_17480 [Paenibacillus sp. BSR1-1]|uniref:hypothetical protein n=1 Tax=Paenibacillus sp. BSR1-1 TaxID=3020845 RepID=UPI0025B1C4DA|nr:hypothetical protein [Paenibacillus sp. BSR1-1]MDN3017990.1 hypothetical protein [Paenibacillus sp. BSR1-1]